MDGERSLAASQTTFPARHVATDSNSSGISSVPSAGSPQAEEEGKLS